MKKFLFLLLAAVSCSRASIIPTELTCEYSQNTVTDIQNPRLSWINCNRHVVNGAAQTAYRIQVSKDKGFDNLVWDSGMELSDRSAFITYEGRPLESRTTYWWRVKVWDQDNKETGWSRPASWSRLSTLPR